MQENYEVQNIQNNNNNNNNQQDNQNVEINLQNIAIQIGARRNSQNNNFSNDEILIVKEICFLFFCVGVEEIAILEFVQISGVSQFIPLGLLGSYPLYKFLKSIFSKDCECQSQSVYIVDSFLECLSVLLICLYFKYYSFYFSFICIPMFISLLLKLDEVKVEGNGEQKDFIHFCKIVGFIIYAAIWVQLLQFSLKMDFFIQMQWQALLWPFWVIFALISLFIIFFLYETMKFTAISHKTHSHKKELLGFFIIFLVLSLFATSLLLTSLKALNYLQDPSKLYQDSYSLVFCFAATPLISLLILTFKGVITETIKFILFYGENSSLDNQIHQQQDGQQIQREIPGLELFEQKFVGDVIKLNINQKKNPIYLQKQSATFFSKSININKNRNESNSKQKELLKEFKCSIKKSVSVDIQKEELRKISQAARHLLGPTIPTLETDIAENKATINQIPFKFPVLSNRLKIENNLEKIEQNQFLNNQEIQLSKDFHDIFSEKNINGTHRKSESCAFRKEDIKRNIYDNSQKQEEESKNTSIQNCLVCFENQPDTVFMNCGHGGICYECALLIWKNTQECYLCRQKVEQLYQLEYNSDNKDNVMKVLSKTIQANQLC
ncbi:zinc finger, C3HC4 type (RING finger) protein (macronuclear) [Tetrahymena thermophila SB210]|uniref:Zinc finger, C3HC4 type (RING finger) protein n=1 Tax=Tetrahymena thermophila (strain SB210) TaxID=312017 RepID=I7MAP5_TETTS|nr:zinc finger, C3HC4 type (RING finger) protein [Tetrahymena thermophila SB210]EAS04995.2 zinc finger, C3HC4 type (RING finger) protein [Tetrahymena thermophila SB210]|eukprot:XP_001025240.2 zinc finger, C3HC4 type (RING finger) protein [Tetrahymena thermophila SB210]